jgi:serine/threonine protein kinase
MANRVGQSLGNYKLVARLGEGGYAEVYEGEHIHLGTHAAIKVLKTIVTGDDIQKFRTEARTIASLEHPNIIRVRDFDIEAGTPFLVMDYAPKGSLKDSRPRGRSLPYVTIVSYIKQIAYALQYAHDQKKLIHRDVKPENMLIMNDDKVVLSDFGIALTAQSGLQDVIGTASYMAPEQIQGHADFASDQYALGIVAYEWLSGDLPFQGNEQEICLQHISKQPPGLNGGVGVPSDIERVILRALEKDPQQRFPSVRDFADALENAYQRAAQEARSKTRPLQSVQTTISESTIDPDSTTAFFSGPIVQPMATAGALIARYDGLLKEFHQLNISYKNALQDNQHYFEFEKARINTALRQEMEQVTQGIEGVREAVRKTQEALQSSLWRKIVASNVVLSVQAPSSLEQMKATQTEAIDLSRRINSSKDRYMNRQGIYPLASTYLVGGAIIIALLYGFY